MFIPAWSVKVVDDPAKATMDEERIVYRVPMHLGTIAGDIVEVRPFDVVEGKKDDAEMISGKYIDVTVAVLVPKKDFMMRKNVELTRIDTRQRDPATGKKRVAATAFTGIGGQDPLTANGPVGLRAMLAKANEREGEEAVPGGSTATAKKLKKTERPMHLLK